MKKLTPDEYRNLVVEHLTVEWMKLQGMDPSDPTTNPIELDMDNDTSQISAWHQTAEEAYDFIVEAIQKIDEMGYEMEEQEEDEEEHEDDLVQAVAEYMKDSLGNGEKTPTPIPEKTPGGAVEKAVMLSIFMQTPPGVPTHVKDVREWLAEVTALDIPDDTEVEGELFLTYDKDMLTSERSECLYCGDKQDILVTIHDCMAGEEDK